MTGFTAQWSTRFFIMPLWHSPQRRQGVTAPGWPWSSFLGRKGSASRARPRATQSTPLSAKKASILSGSEKAPTVHTGVLTCFLISAARAAFSPCLWNTPGCMSTAEYSSSWVPAETWISSTLPSSALAISMPVSRP